MVSLVNPTPWAPVIGRLFLAFGSIESTTHEGIRDWAGETVHKHVARAGLSSRIDLLLDLAAKQDASDASKEALSDALRKAKALAKYRNLVAHNPLCLVFFQDDDREPPFVEAIAGATDDKHISLQELERVSAEAEECSQMLLHSYVAFRAEKLDLASLRSFPGLGSSAA